MSKQFVQTGEPRRDILVKRGQRLEYFSVAYNSLEGALLVRATRKVARRAKTPSASIIAP